MLLQHSSLRPPAFLSASINMHTMPLQILECFSVYLSEKGQGIHCFSALTALLFIVFGDAGNRKPRPGSARCIGRSTTGRRILPGLPDCGPSAGRPGAALRRRTSVWGSEGRLSPRAFVIARSGETHARRVRRIGPGRAMRVSSSRFPVVPFPQSAGLKTFANLSEWLLNESF